MSATEAAAIEHLKSWVGSTLSAQDTVTPELVRRFNATIDRLAAEPQIGDAVPPMLHFCLAQPTVPASALGPDGHPRRGGFLPPVPLPRRMWAGGSVDFVEPLRVGDMVERRSRVDDVAMKHGRSGQLCFVTVGHEIIVDGEVRIRERQDIVYRDAPVGSPTSPVAAAALRDEPSEHRREVEVSVAQLFRYSAITFNAHRIHYDRPYATNVEGYAGLVVHGPLQATLLAAMASEIGGRAPTTFSFRAETPLFDDAPFALHARFDGADLALWTARPGGPKAMSARASW